MLKVLGSVEMDHSPAGAPLGACGLLCCCVCDGVSTGAADQWRGRQGQDVSGLQTVGQLVQFKVEYYQGDQWDGLRAEPGKTLR